ncbi:hypothetical protein IFM89_024996, partial [Coptis chinensis]
MITDDPSLIGSSLAQYVDLVYPDKGSVLHKIEKIDKCFGQDTVEEIIDALENEVATNYDEWCTLALKKLKEASPLSLKVSLRSIREGRFQSLDQCLSREYRLSLRSTSKHVSDDFCEGVRARLVDKDYAPKNAKSKENEDVITLSGDHLYRMDYMDFIQSHHRESGADITLSCLPMDD